MYSLYVDEVNVPLSLLLTRELKASEKIVWMALTMDDQLEESFLFSPSRLGRRTGMSRPTVRRATAKLTTEGWFAPPARRGPSQAPAQKPSPDRVSVPVELVMATEIHAQAKLVYALLLSKPTDPPRKRQFTYAELAGRMSLSPQTVKHAARQLAKHGWLEMEQAHKRAPIRFSLHNPVDKRNVKEILDVQDELHRATHLGEALMQAIFLALVDCLDFDDGMRPGFMRNPATGKRLEVDLFYYLHNTAMEFNGAQHYRVTERNSAEQVHKQQCRDQTKQQICAKKKIKLIVIQAHELSCKIIKRKIRRRLPFRRGQDFNRRLINYLECRCGEYQQRIDERGWGTASQSERKQDE
ncbi:MAG: hypothetical protein ACOX4G_04065 [Limnochordia bacterium]